MFPKVPAISHRAALCVLALIVLASAALSVANTVACRPWWDEGIIVNPAYNLVHHGFMGTTVQYGRGLSIDIDFPQYDRYTYWALPVYLLTLAGWIRVFGASIISTRLLSVLFGDVLVVAWYLIVRRLIGSRLAALVAALFVAVDFSVIRAASTTRMDCMAAALGACGLAAYLGLRGKRFNLALLVGNAFTAAALLTHPVGAVPVLTLLVLILCLDRRSIGWKSLPLVALPYVVFLSGWGLYLLKDPAVAMAQLHANSAHRMGGISAPLRSIASDAARRYWTYFYVVEHGARKLKALMLLEYILGVGLALGLPRLRKLGGVRILLAVAGVAYVALAVIDGAKSPHYMLATCTVFAALWGVVVSSSLQRRSTAALVAVAACGFLLVHVAAAVQRARADSYRKDFVPVIEFLKANKAGETAPIVGPSELWFGLGPRAALLDDMRLGYYSGWHPRWIVTDEFYDDAFRNFQWREPLVWSHVQRVLGHFDKVFSTKEFTVYCERRTPS
jgi:4-amino-4-deoxy-L-arabinose transferase-like glycosyltransferase